MKKTQLEALATNYGFVISGLDQISTGAAQRSGEGNVEDRLKSLLEDYICGYRAVAREDREDHNYQSQATP
jgi:hypothetical protein